MDGVIAGVPPSAAGPAGRTTPYRPAPPLTWPRRVSSEPGVEAPAPPSTSPQPAYGPSSPADAAPYE